MFRVKALRPTNFPTKGLRSKRRSFACIFQVVESISICISSTINMFHLISYLDFSLGSFVNTVFVELVAPVQS